MKERMETENKDLLRLKFEAERKRLHDEKEARIREHWETLGKFENPYDVPAIPRVEKNEYREFYVPKLIKAGAIPKKDLVHGNCYLGNHRNCTVAKWNAEKNVFEYWRHKFGVFLDVCNHFEDDDGYALFVPIKEVDPEEFKKTKEI